MRALSEMAEKVPGVQGKFHIKIPHIQVGWSRDGHSQVIIGRPGPDEPEEPETPDAPGTPGRG